MKNWTVGNRVEVGLGAVLAMMMLLAAFVFMQTRTIRTQFATVSDTAVPAMNRLSAIKARMEKNLGCVYLVVMETNKAEISKLTAAIKSAAQTNNEDWAAYEKLVGNNSSRALIEQLTVARDKYRAEREAILKEALSTTNLETASALFYRSRTRLAPLTADYVGILDALLEAQKSEVAQAGENTAGAIRQSYLGLAAGSVGALLIGTLLGFFITRSVNTALKQVATTLNDGAEQVASSATQVSAASQSLANGASEQAAAIEETSSSLEEMASMTKRNAENSQKANDLARQTRTAAERGATDMQSMSAAMAGIKGASDDVAKIIRTIDEIAFQTNILALNAAVEAARAGEAGMGFAVVADEVRNLARRSAQAAKETAAKIEGAITKTAQGVQLSGKVSEALSEIVGKARQMDELAASVAGASQEQSQGITQLNAAVGQMDQATQGNAASAEECAAAAEELNSQAQCMKAAVADLLKLTSGDRRVLPRQQNGQGEPRRNHDVGQIDLPSHPSVALDFRHTESGALRR